MSVGLLQFKITYCTMYMNCGFEKIEILEFITHDSHSMSLNLLTSVSMAAILMQLTIEG